MGVIRWRAGERVLITSSVSRWVHDDRHGLVDQRARRVLHLAGGIALGVDVGDLLELERPFEGERKGLPRPR